MAVHWLLIAFAQRVLLLCARLSCKVATMKAACPLFTQEDDDSD